MIRQRSLQLLRFRLGDADGKARPETREAVSELQHRKTPKPSGEFDTGTLNALKKIADEFTE
jgi:peptidoglycan hydrolase-like protein with peptidoglycan-binding domain